jgi:hypothetical protein
MTWIEIESDASWAIAPGNGNANRTARMLMKRLFVFIMLHPLLRKFFAHAAKNLQVKRFCGTRGQRSSLTICHRSRRLIRRHPRHCADRAVVLLPAGRSLGQFPIRVRQKSLETRGTRRESREIFSRLHHRCYCAAAMIWRRNCRRLRLLFLAEFLEARVTAKRVEHRIEPEQGGRERRCRFSERALIRYR